MYVHSMMQRCFRFSSFSNSRPNYASPPEFQPPPPKKKEKKKKKPILRIFLTQIQLGEKKRKKRKEKKMPGPYMNYIVCMILYIQYTQSKRWAPRLGRLCIIEYIRRLSLLFQLEYIYTGMLAHLSNPAGILEDDK